MRLTDEVDENRAVLEVVMGETDRVVEWLLLLVVMVELDQSPQPVVVLVVMGATGVELEGVQSCHAEEV